MNSSGSLSDTAAGPQRGTPPARPGIDPQLFRQVMGLFTTGITVIATNANGATHGMTANAFMAGSLEPPLCIISVRKEARLCSLLELSGSFGVSILSEQQRHLSNHFAGRRLGGLEPDFERLAGQPVLSRALATIAADIVDSVDCGDHTMFIGHIAAMRPGGGRPLLFSAGRYARVDDDHPIERIEPPTFW